MSDDSYAWKSAATPDPYSGQRAMNKQLQRNQRHAAEIAHLRGVAADPDGVKLPTALRTKTAALREATSTLAEQTGAYRSGRAKYM